MRTRLLKPEFFTDEELAEIPYEGRLLFAGLWCLADRTGRLHDRPKTIKAKVFPFDALDVVALLTQLHAAGFIDRYTVDDVAVIQVRRFLKHQSPHPREKASELPRNPNESAKPRPSREIAGTGPSVSVSVSVPVSVSKNVSSAAPAPPEPAVLTFPCVGPVKTWTLLQSQLALWTGLYPHLDVEAECRRALAWVGANPPKTAKGTPRFLVRWLNRVTDTAPPASPRGAAAAWRPTHHPWECPHDPPCSARHACHVLTQLGRPVKKSAVAS